MNEPAAPDNSNDPASGLPRPNARAAAGHPGHGSAGQQDRQALGAALDRLLGDQLAAVRRRFLWHGLAITLLLPAALILSAFLLDHFLRLPTPIRLFHTLLTIGAVIWAAQRFVRYPLGKPLQPVDIALAVERSFPELHQRLVSALQLKGSLAGDDVRGLRNQSPAMIEQLLRDTASHARTLPLERMFDNRATGRLAAGAAAVTLLLVGGAISSPDTAIAFILRHLGRDVPYPRATHLVVELPPASADLQRTDSEGRTDLVLPAGADLHVSVYAADVVPDVVELVLQAGGSERAVTTTPRGNGRFRYVFRRVASEFSFYARGGDDDRGDRVVHVRTIHPPLVAQIKAELQPPAYTGRQSTVQNGGAIEALTGSAVTLSVMATGEVEAATLTFLETGREISLARTAVTDDAGTVIVHTGSFTVAESDRYQIQLVGESGLRNPNPGTYPVTALQDYAPVGRWLQPDDESSTLLVPDSILCVRGLARDDFGLVAIEVLVDAGQNRTSTRQLLESGPGDGADAPRASHPTELTFIELIDVSTLLGAQRAADGLSLELVLRDNRQPEAGVTELPRRQVQIVDEAQLAAAIGRHFRGLREEVQQSLELQLDRKERLEELLQTGADPGLATAQVLTAVEVGQGRIQGAGERLHRGMMRAFDTHLFNKLEPSQNAPTVVELYLRWHRENGQAVSFQPGFYRQVLAQRRAGTLGAMEQSLDPILAMIDLCDRLATAQAPPSLRLLAEAQVARNRADLEQKLRATVELQAAIVTTLEDLLGRLEEWNDYQDLVQEARALREKQRDVQNRTEELRGRK